TASLPILLDELTFVICQPVETSCVPVFPGVQRCLANSLCGDRLNRGKEWTRLGFLWALIAQVDERFPWNLEILMSDPFHASRAWLARKVDPLWRWKDHPG